MVKKGIIKKVKEFREAIENNGIHVNKIILYGSQASGRHHKDSDIDVAVISTDFSRNRFGKWTKLWEIAYKVDSRIEPVPYSLKSFQKDTWVPLIYEIRTKGIEIKADK